MASNSPTLMQSEEEFLNKKEEIVTLCNTFNARKYFWINTRNCKQVEYEIIKKSLEAKECNYKNISFKW